MPSQTVSVRLLSLGDFSQTTVTFSQIVWRLHQFATGLAGKQARLSWASSPGHRYHVERSTDLGPGSWRRVAQVTGKGPNASWMDLEVVKTRCFYRVLQPGPEVFAIEPSVLSESGGVLRITGQNLPPTGYLAMDVEGAGRIVTPYTQVTDDDGSIHWRVTLSGSFTAGALISNVAIIDGVGAVVSPVDLSLSITASGYAVDGPASLPPGAPLALGASKPVPGIGVIVKKHPPNHGSGTGTMSAGFWNDWHDVLIADDMGATESLAVFWLSKKGYDYYSSKKGYDYYQTGSGKMSTVGNNPLYKGSGIRSNPLAAQHRIAPASSGLPGEVSFHYDALSLPNFAGPPLAWIMTYRSTRPVSSGHGPQWDFSYNIRMEAAQTDAPSVTIHDGGGRADVLRREPDGTYRCDGLFREGAFAGDVFTLTFADRGKWVFLPLDGSPAAGKIASIIDRNEVALTCAYDAATGRLTSVRDSFDRLLTVSWSAVGSAPRITSIADHTGRSVHFTTYSGGAGDEGGPEGALKSISQPTAAGGATGSPGVSFTYTQGALDGALNHNLLSIRDGANRLLEGFAYSSETDPGSPDYDRCTGHDRHAGGVTRTKRVANSSGGYTSYEVDEVGRLTEMDCDRQHRVLAIRNFTGFSNPGLPADATSNRPGAPLRDTDPLFFESRFSWNPDHGLTSIVDAAGSELHLVYDREFRPGCPVRERGNIRSMTLRGADGTERVVACEHLAGYGVCESARPGNPIRGMTVKGGRNPSPDSLIWSPRSNILDPDDDGDGIPAVDEVLLARHKGWDGKVKGSGASFDSNPLRLGIVRRGHFQEQIAGAYEEPLARAKDEGGRHTPFHNKYRPLYAARERGITISTSHIEYETSRIVVGELCDDGDCDDDSSLFRKILDYGEAGDNRAFATRVITAHGQSLQWTFDEHGNRTSYVSALPNRGVLYQYDSAGRCTGVTVRNGEEPSYEAEFTYDSATGFLQSSTIDPGGLAITTTYQYDAVGRCVAEIDPLGREWNHEFNPADQLVRLVAPPHGSSGARISMSLHYDDGARLARCDVDEEDEYGDPIDPNSTHSTFYVRDDQRAELVRVAVEERPVDVGTALTPDPAMIQRFAVVDFTRNAAGEIARVSTPAACRESAEDLACDFSYDERGLVHEVTMGGVGAASAVTDRYDYEPDGLPARHVRVGADGSGPTTEVTYDGFRRVSTITDPMGNLAVFSHDNRGGVACSIYGQTNDITGGAGNTLLAQASIQSSTGREPTGVLAIACTGGLHEEKSFESVIGGSPFPESPFHRWFVKDDTVTQDRFVAGQTAPYPRVTTVVTRSPAGLPVQITRNGDLLVSYGHDRAGRVRTCANGACVVTRELDDNGNSVACATTHLRSGAPPKTFTVTYAYDPLGRLVSKSDGVGNTTSYGYDFLGRVTSIQRPGGAVISCAHNGETPDGLPFARRISADLDGDGAPDVVVSSYARCGELKSVTDPLGYVTSIHQDSSGRFIRCDYPDGTYETQSYGALGFPDVRRMRDGSTRDDDCDLNGRVATRTVDHPDPAVSDIVTEYSHDGLGRTCTCHQGAYIVSRTYDSLGNRTRESRNGLHVDSTYDHRGRTSLLTSVQGPYQLHQTEQRDASGRLLAIRDATVAGSPPPVVSFEYLGLLVSKATLANGVSTEFSYRGDGDAAEPGTVDFSFGARATRELVRRSGIVLGDCVRSRDPDQALVGETILFGTDVAGPGRSKSIARDALGRITGCVISRREAIGTPVVTELDVGYALDARGDRQTATGTNPGAYSQSATDAARARYSTWPGGALAWDEACNLTSMARGSAPGATHEYHYDAIGRLTSVSDGSGSILLECTYDGFDRLVSVDSPASGASGGGAVFLYDGSTCVQELGDGGAAAANFITSGGILYAMKTAAGTSHYAVANGDVFRSMATPGDNTPIIRGSALGGLNDDPRLSMRMMTDATGAVTERFDCDDAGRPRFLDASGLPSTASSSSVGLRWMAPECAWESEIDLYLCPGRTYSPDLGTTVSLTR